MSKSTSLNQKAWMRFKRNKAAMFGLYVIVVVLFVAVFAYPLAPDHTPDANEQNLPIALMKPGSTISMLYIYRPSPQAGHRSFLQNFFAGTPGLYEALAIQDNYRIKMDFIYVTPFKSHDISKAAQKKIYYTDIINSDSIIKIKSPVGDVSYIAAYKTVNAGNNTDTNSANNTLLREIKSDSTAYRSFCSYMRTRVYKTNLKKTTFWLGTDRFGRDILSRLIVGSRISLFVGLVSVLISLLIGIILGAIAGYFRGWADAVILWIINVFWSIPTILLAMGLYVGAGTIIPSRLLLIFIAVGLTMWVEVARIVRGQFIQVRELEYVTAAQSLGFSSVRTIFRHILPNILGPVIVVACANFANAILIESGLSYIGLGVQPPTPSWGGMLSEYKNFIDSDKAFLALAPGLAIMLLVLAFNLVGNGLRDALDVKGKAEA